MAVQVGGALVAAGGDGCHVVLVAHQVHRVLLLPGFDLERAGAHGGGAILFLAALQRSGGLDGDPRHGEGLQQRVVRGLELQLEGGFVEGLHGVDLAQGQIAGGGGRLGIEQVLEVRLHGGGVQRGAVGERDAFADLHGAGEPVRGDARNPRRARGPACRRRPWCTGSPDTGRTPGPAGSCRPRAGPGRSARHRPRHRPGCRRPPGCRPRGRTPGSKRTGRNRRAPGLRPGPWRPGRGDGPGGERES